MMFTDADHQARFDRDGFVTLRLFDAAQVARLRELYDCTVAGDPKTDLYESSRHNTLEKNAAQVTQQIADRKAKARRDKEQQAVLQNGTDEFKRIVEYPEKHLYGHYYFDGLFDKTRIQHCGGKTPARVWDCNSR